MAVRPRSAIRTLSYLGIGASDGAAWEQYATEILGLAVNRCADNALELRLDDDCYIAVEPGNDDLAYVGWLVNGEAELAEIGEALAEARVPVRAGTSEECRRRRVCGMTICEDPAGIRTEIVWGPLVDSQPSRAQPAAPRFVTGEEGLGHIVITVPDAERTMAFYHDVLGMRISDFVEFDRRGTMVTMAFLHCNPRHHSLAFMELPSEPKRLSHIMLEARVLDDVGRTYSLCEQRGIPIAMTLGRHTNDEMLSFYGQTPSGFNIEFGWGGRKIDDETWHVKKYNAPSTWGHARSGQTQRKEEST